ncbi:MAG: hypothetical protein IH851_13125 [Armatimonadetes bacterium]|nr:hypothetical protein [Armatimonadota bacterium]
MQSKLQRLGFPEERRKFEPHLTLARIKNKPPEELALIFEEYEKTEFGSAAVRSVAFSPDGALLAIGGLDRVVSLWHVEVGEAPEPKGGRAGSQY